MSTIPVTTVSPVDLRTTQAVPASLVDVLRWAGSLKIAVGSFVAAMGLILVGTLAQVNQSVWQVLEAYFNAWLTWVDASILFPTPWFPTLTSHGAAVWLAIVTAAVTSVIAILLMINESAIARARTYAAVVWAVGMSTAFTALWRGGIWYPGGALIGSIMAVNLIAAHVTRYKIRARGHRLTIGLVVTAAGILAAWLLILSGHNSNGFQGQPRFEWTTLWTWMKAVASIVALTLVTYGMFGNVTRPYVRIGLLTGGVVLAITSIWLWSTGNATYLGDAGMRVLWQLTTATFVGMLLLAGCVLLFYQRAGVVVLHMGVGLLMFGQWYVYQYDVEEQVTFAPGQEMNYGQDVRSVELAVIRRNAPEFDGQDDVHAVPLTRNGHSTSLLAAKSIDEASLPFNIEIVQYEENAQLKSDASTQIPVDQGDNRGFAIVPLDVVSGTSESIDLASGYFRVVDRTTHQPIGTYLLSQEVLLMGDGRTRSFDRESFTHNGATYDLQLRFKRNYKPYKLRLLEFHKDDYLGTDIAKNYESVVQLVDPDRQINQKINIKMNNPGRYAGETFYQSRYQSDETGKVFSVLQVVRNRGWMIPYVACMITVVGMLYHFGNVLLRFLDRRARSEDVVVKPHGVWSRYGIPVGSILLALLGAAFWQRPPATHPGEFNFVEFGKLPVIYQGRVEPFDTLARNTLRFVSDSESLRGILPRHELKEAWPKFQSQLGEKYPAMNGVDIARFQNGDVRGLIQLIQQKTAAEDDLRITDFVEGQLFRRQPAVRWALDCMTGSDDLRRHKVIRIYHDQVLDLLGLPRRPSHRYSIEEIVPSFTKFGEQREQAIEAQRSNPKTVSLYHKKILELDQKLSAIMSLHRAFSPPDLPPLPSAEDFQTTHDQAMTKLRGYLEAISTLEEAFNRQPVPLAIPPASKDDAWQTYALAWPKQALMKQLRGIDPPESFRTLNGIMLAYLDGDVKQFDEHVTNYQRILERLHPQELQAKTSLVNSWVENRYGNFYRFESEFNRLAPFVVCAYLYVLAFVILALGWLRYTQTMNRIAFWLLVCTFVAHTLALAARIYISGRPPITNLYSSAVGIGWFIILLSLGFEAYFRRGVASLAASVLGFVTLLIAYKLAAEGDTMKVLMAVLDTQFWLATHVVCISFGYATTFLAGGFGILYIVTGLFTKSLTVAFRREISRMIYGTVCFAIFFSFFGTVLGGLWADESWGRFWGWDPKENGALIIVLWNALILHAVWDKMVSDRGLAVLATLGNVVTAWSWFGVNELNVGLHSYGFTEGRLVVLGLSVAGLLAVTILGCLPASWWRSFANSHQLAEVDAAV